jgi:hypothetical protein
VSSESWWPDKAGDSGDVWRDESVRWICKTPCPGLSEAARHGEVLRTIQLSALHDRDPTQ